MSCVVALAVHGNSAWAIAEQCSDRAVLRCTATLLRAKAPKWEWLPNRLRIPGARAPLGLLLVNSKTAWIYEFLDGGMTFGTAGRCGGSSRNAGRGLIPRRRGRQGGEGGIRTHEACAYVISSDAP